MEVWEPLPDAEQGEATAATEASMGVPEMESSEGGPSHICQRFGFRLELLYMTGAGDLLQTTTRVDVTTLTKLNDKVY